jgi:large subunit ribosomal protein L22
VAGTKTNERPGTRAQVKFSRMSAYKARQVLDLIRGQEVSRADEILKFSERDAAIVIRKCLASAVANAQHNDGLDPDELYVASCYADEGVTIKRWRPRARGRATRIRKRTCHITVIVSRMTEEQLDRRRQREESRPGSRAARRAGQQAAEARRQRVARSRRQHDHDHAEEEAAPTEEAAAVETVEGVEEAPEVGAAGAEAELAAESDAGAAASAASTDDATEDEDEDEDEEGEK